MAENEELEDAWPVPDKPKPVSALAGEDAEERRATGESAFLLNLISPLSRRDLIPLAELEDDLLLEAFLSGGPEPPRVAGLWIPSEVAMRLTPLINAVFTRNYEDISADELRVIRDEPPHVLLVYLESHDSDPEAIIRMVCTGLGKHTPEVIALIGKNNEETLKHPPSWAKAVVSLSLPDEVLRLQFDEIVRLSSVRKDLEVIFLAHRVSREQLNKVTFTDPLTGLMNRAGFQDSAARELARITRTNGTLGLIILDIDRFKKVNDTYGHPVGDSVLRELSRILRAQSRNLDHVIRFGGEEFGIILPHTNFDDLLLVAERIREAVEAFHFESIPKAGDITISLGALCISASRRPTLDDVYPVCDELLYQAKQTGRNKVVSDRYE